MPNMTVPPMGSKPTPSTSKPPNNNASNSINNAEARIKTLQRRAQIDEQTLQNLGRDDLRNRFKGHL